MNDLLIFAKDKSDIEQIKKLIKKTHSMKNIKEVSKILSIHVTRESNSSIKINQNHYIHQILVKFSMKNTKLTAMSMNSSIKLDDQISEMLHKKDHKLYQQMMKKLMFAAVATRIDIASAVNRLSQYLSEPCSVHLQAAKHILRYLRGSPELEILYKSINDDLISYADAVYVNARLF